jgi:hypothetical protein
LAIADDDVEGRFTLEREVVNWNTEYIEGQIRSLIAATKYHGVVSVTFPVAHSKVVVQSPDKANRSCFFSMISFMYKTNRYEVLKAIWPYATSQPGSAASETMPRQCAVQSEESWWNDWKNAIRYAVLQKRKGWVTAEDRIEAAMRPAYNSREWSFGV